MVKETPPIIREVTLLPRWLRVRTAKWAWAGWLILGVCVGLALPRALLIMHAVVSI